MNRITRTITVLLLAVSAGCAGATAASAPPATVASPPVAETEPPSTTASTTTTTQQAPAAPAAQRESAADDTLDPGCFADLARAVGWPEETIPHLVYIMRRESNCDPSAFADRPWTLDLSRGLLQINAFGSLDAGIRRSCGIDPATLLDPEVNLRCGLAMFGAMGWGPWGG